MKQRIDELLVEQKYFQSQIKAQAAIMAGLILADEQKILKPGTLVDTLSKIRILGGSEKYVSRGGMKLEHALKEFRINVSGKIAIDIGASTGGFTDCLLQNGAQKIYAVDVGYGQFAWKLRQDKRVVVLEKTNARNLKKEAMYKEEEPADLAVIDVSFISLDKILPVVYDLIRDNAEVVALVKPQFEAKKAQVGKGGIVKDPEVYMQVIKRISGNAKNIGYKVCGLILSPITGADGNKEFLLYLKKIKDDESIDIENKMNNMIG